MDYPKGSTEILLPWSLWKVSAGIWLLPQDGLPLLLNSTSLCRKEQRQNSKDCKETLKTAMERFCVTTGIAAGFFFPSAIEMESLKVS